MNLFATSIFLVFWSFLFAQNYNYAPSAFHFKNQSLEELFSEKYSSNKSELCTDCNREEKKILKSFLAAQLDHNLEMLKSGDFIIDGPVYEYVNDIYAEIASSNPELQNKKILIYRTDVPNAFTMGNDIIYIHLGLLHRLQNKDQLAFIICHEIAHETLRHAQQNLYDYIAQKTDSELEKKINSILREKYGQVTKLNELLVPNLLVKREKSRAFEFSADSLGMVYFSNSEFNEKNACTTFDILLHADKVRDTIDLDFKTLLNLDASLIDIAKVEEYKNESSLGAFDDKTMQSQDVIKKRNEMNDLLRTHPFEVDRAVKMYDYLNIMIPEEFDSVIHEDYLEIRYNSDVDLIQTNLVKLRMDKLLFYSLNLLKKYPKDEYAEFNTALAFLIIHHHKKQFKETYVVKLQDENNDPAYDKLVYFLRNLNADETYRIGKTLFEKLPSDNFSIEYQLARLLIQYQERDNESFMALYDLRKVDFIKSPYNKLTSEMYWKVVKRK